MNRFASRFFSIVCAVVGILALCDRAAAEVRSHSASGTAQFVSATDFVGTGNATHLGLYTEVGSVVFSPTGNPAVLHVDGSVVYTAANGDQLRAVIGGELNGLTGAIAATVSYVGGTGRFAQASGSASLAGQIGAGGIISVTVSGTIDY
jgi:hypothetical protein